jgi:hypothetical protein
MKTDELIRLLAAGAGPARDGVVRQRVGTALGVGVAASAAACVATLGLNPGILAMGPALWVKLMYVTGLLAAAGWWLSRLARPAASARWATAALAAVVVAMTAWTARVLIEAPAAGWTELLLGQSWMSCPWRVAALAIPALAMAIWALRGLAPTRLRLAGFAAGLVGGAAGALAYSLFCSEASPAFVLIWYSLGMLLPAGIGAWLGPRLLRW